VLALNTTLPEPGWNMDQQIVNLSVAARASSRPGCMLEMGRLDGASCRTMPRVFTPRRSTPAKTVQPTSVPFKPVPTSEAHFTSAALKRARLRSAERRSVTGGVAGEVVA